MSGIVKRLRRQAMPDPHDEREVMHAALLREAADEIERARKAAKAERERCLAACKDTEEPTHHGYEPRYFFNDGRNACIDAIEALPDEVRINGHTG